MFIFDQLKLKALEFEAKINNIKATRPDIYWYPYATMTNFIHMENMFRQGNGNLFERLENKLILDLGCGDGHLGYYLEENGFDVDLIDNHDINANHMEGVKYLKNKLNSKAALYDMDIDMQFNIPRDSYDLIIFFGVLYHLRNPFYLLEKLSYHANFLLLSTRITKYTPDCKLDLSHYSLAYLLQAGESENGDSTNYFIFTEKGLETMIKRAGWGVMNYMTVGNMENADPHSIEHDGRAFYLLHTRRM